MRGLLVVVLMSFLPMVYGGDVFDPANPDKDSKFTTKTIRWFAESEDLAAATESAFKLWNEALGGYFTFQEVPVGSYAELRVLDKRVPEVYNGGIKTFSHTNFDNHKEILFSEISFDYLPVSKKDEAVPFRWFLKAVGLSLGLEANSTNNAVVMKPQASWDTLHKEDIDRICTLYGVTAPDFAVSLWVVPAKGNPNIYTINLATVYEARFYNDDRKKYYFKHSYKFHVRKDTKVTVDYRGYTKELTFSPVLKKK